VHQEERGSPLLRSANIFPEDPLLTPRLERREYTKSEQEVATLNIVPSAWTVVTMHGPVKALPAGLV